MIKSEKFFFGGFAAEKEQIWGFERAAGSLETPNGASALVLRNMNYVDK